jgi:hypothetical protein
MIPPIAGINDSIHQLERGVHLGATLPQSASETIVLTHLCASKIHSTPGQSVTYLCSQYHFLSLELILWRTNTKGLNVSTDSWSLATPVCQVRCSYAVCDHMLTYEHIRSVYEHIRQHMDLPIRGVVSRTCSNRQAHITIGKPVSRTCCNRQARITYVL